VFQDEKIKRGIQKNRFVLKNLKKWKYLQEGGLIGASVGFVIYGISTASIVTVSGAPRTFWSYQFIEIVQDFGANQFCSLVRLILEECGLAFALFSWIIFPLVYGIIGALIGLIVGKSKKYFSSRCRPRTRRH